MNTDITGIILTFVIALLLAVPLGKYISRVFKGEKTLLDFIAPAEKLIFRISGIRPDEEMNWKQNMKAMITINIIWFIWSVTILMFQDILFLNPDHIPAMSFSQAFNTAVSFVTNTNLQHYSGETGASYLSQLTVMCFLQFVSAGTGIASAALLFKGLANRSGSELGNFYVLLVRSCTRILMPLAIILGMFLFFNGSPVTLNGAQQVITLQGDTVRVAEGPVTPLVSIKLLGTNGGGFFGTNSAHPFENPNSATNAAGLISIILIPVAMVFAFGYYLNRKKFAIIILSVMTAGFTLLAIPAVHFEMQGNPELKRMGISQPMGNMEGKEIRFGPVSSAFWGVETTCTSNGSVNSMHDSFMPIPGMMLMLGMQLNAFFGGVGVGFINIFVFIILAIFISGLMAGRTPELLRKKIEEFEIRTALLVGMIHPVLILGGTALAAYIWSVTPGHDEVLNWLNNKFFHGFSEIFYEFTSAGSNNGSGFEGLKDNTDFWNFGTGLSMLIGRFIPIIGPVAIAGSLSLKKQTPESAGSLKTDSLIFGIVLFMTIFILGALLFFPGLVLGPAAEYFTLKSI